MAASFLFQKVLKGWEAVLLFMIAFIFIIPGILCLITAVHKLSFMEKWRQKGIGPSRNHSRLYFLFLAAVLMYCGILLLKTLWHKGEG